MAKAPWGTKSSHAASKSCAYWLSRVWLFATLWMDCSLPGSSVDGISQAKILECVAIPFSRGSFWPRDRTLVSCMGRPILYCLSHKKKWLDMCQTVNFTCVMLLALTTALRRRTILCPFYIYEGTKSQRGWVTCPRSHSKCRIEWCFESRTELVLTVIYQVEREVGGGIGMGNTCKPMAVSFQCMTKSITI